MTTISQVTILSLWR